MNNMKTFIGIVDGSTLPSVSIINLINESTIDELVLIIEHMDDDRIESITEMLDDDTLIEGITEADKDGAKSMWQSALQGAKNILSGKAFGKLKGMIANLRDTGKILSGWEQYKAQYKVEGDKPIDFVRFLQTEFPELSNDTFLTTAKSVSDFDLDAGGNITNFDGFLAALMRTVNEKIKQQVSGEITDEPDVEPTPAEPAAPADTKPQKSVLSKLATAARDNKNGTGNANRLISSAEASLKDLGYGVGDINAAKATLGTAPNPKNAMKHEKTRDFLAMIGYHALKNMK